MNRMQKENEKKFYPQKSILRQVLYIEHVEFIRDSRGQTFHSTLYTLVDH